MIVLCACFVAWVVAKCHHPEDHNGHDLRSHPCLPADVFSPHTPGAAHREFIRSQPRGSGQRKVEIVIANCQEEFYWMRWVPSVDYHIAVYEKCHDLGRILDPAPLSDATVAFKRKNIRRTFLNNTGEEASAYLRYIVDHYDELPDIAFFLQGNGGHHSHAITFLLDSLRRDLDFVSISNMYIGYVSALCCCVIDSICDSYNRTGAPNAYLGDMIPYWYKKLFDIDPINVLGSFCCG
jgi:hypothetical protein